ncbi:MAG: ATP-grasp domain-containing protein [Planctomycetia bacterium]|nr:ATP-grasp domain-containing protein [Planctomycetia bacterium]
MTLRLPSRAFLQKPGVGRPIPEVRSLDAYFARKAVPCEWFVEKQLVRRQLALDRGSFVGGTIPVMTAALKQIGATPPQPNDYPASLQSFLARRIWTSTVGAVTARCHADGQSVFVKPKGNTKRFTGFVLGDPGDLWKFENTSKRQDVWCSEVVVWKSEWRIYVAGGVIVDRRRYTGDPEAEPDREVVDACIRALHDGKEEWAGYGLDVGILSGGRTAVVEMNDGIGLGSYGVEDDVYAELVLGRWYEIVG